MTARPTALAVTEHRAGCDQPGMVWQDVVKAGLPVLGVCPACGAAERRRYAPPFQPEPDPPRRWTPRDDKAAQRNEIRRHRRIDTNRSAA